MAALTSPSNSNSLPPALQELASGSDTTTTTTYCRKHKSLGLLCINFLRLYNRDGVETVGVDDAASQLGVERRRIYDVVNVLESLGVLDRKAKNSYNWRGIGAIPKALQQLKEEGFKENGDSVDMKTAKVSDDEDEETLSNPSASNHNKINQDSMQKGQGSAKTENRKEKSLFLLTQNFVKLFLCTKMDMLSLDDAAKILLGEARNPSLTRAKVRRLYDISNILSSMNIIEKTLHPYSKKPAFRWLGTKGLSEGGTAKPVILKESKKRVFGTELTNICFKRTKLDSSIDADGHHNRKRLLHSQSQCNPVGCNAGRCSSEQGSGYDAKSYRFGPFAPVSLPKSRDTRSNKLRKVPDWDSLASTYRPQYHNQALKDLFVHYVEAWNSWYSEVAGMDPIRAIS